MICSIDLQSHCTVLGMVQHRFVTDASTQLLEAIRMQFFQRSRNKEKPQAVDMVRTMPTSEIQLLLTCSMLNSHEIILKRQWHEINRAGVWLRICPKGRSYLYFARTEFNGAQEYCNGSNFICMYPSNHISLLCTVCASHCPLESFNNSRHHEDHTPSSMNHVCTGF